MNEGRVLVTGGNGRLGRAVLQALSTRGVAGVRRRDAATDAILIESGDRLDPKTLAGFAAIINCAGCVTGTSREIEQANITYPTSLAGSARAAGVQRFVQVSSFSIFGRCEYIDANSPLAPTTIYGQSKLAAEHALSALNNADFRAIPLRLPFMFSAEEPALLGRLVKVILRLGVLPTLAATPSRRSMITYAGAAEALISLALAPDVPSEPLAIADPIPLELLTVARLIRERLNRRIKIVHIPPTAVTIAAMALPTLVDRLFRSSVLAPSENLMAGGGKNRVEAALARYLDRVAASRLSGQHLGR